MNRDVESVIQKESEFKRKMISGYILLNWESKYHEKITKTKMATKI